MILPNLPSKFSSGETLTAAKLNALIEWMRAVSAALPGLQVNAGPGLSFTRGAAGTTLSIARGYLQGGGTAAPADDSLSESKRFTRRLFNWTSAAKPEETEEGTPEDQPRSYSVSVSGGVACVRIHELVSSGVPSNAIRAVPAFTGEVSVAVQKTELVFTPEKSSSEYAVISAVKLADDAANPDVNTEIDVKVSVPGYTLTQTGTRSVVAGITQKKNPHFCGFSNGGMDETRTRDLLRDRQAF